MKSYLPYAVAALAALFAWQYWRAGTFERRARAAETFAESRQAAIDSLRIRAAWAEAAAKHVDTVVVRLRATVAHVDSIFPPDSSCAPNLAARDSLIATQAAEIDTLKVATEHWRAAFYAVSAVRDTLAKALASRPAVQPRFRGPSIGPALWVYPGELRVGVSIQFAGIGL